MVLDGTTASNRDINLAEQPLNTLAATIFASAQRSPEHSTSP